MLKSLGLVRNSRITRRYIVINGFDGVITILGILLGSYYVGTENTDIVLAACLGAAIAMAISGISGAYLSERAEKMKELRELERAMLADLGKSRISRASKIAPLVSASAHGLSPFIFSLFILLPFILKGIVQLSIQHMYFISFFLVLLCLVFLGVFMARTAKENAFSYVIKTIVVGVITAAVLLLLRLVF